MARGHVLSVLAVLVALAFASAACDGLFGIGVLSADGGADDAPGTEAGGNPPDAEACVLGQSTVGHCVLR